MNTTVFSPPAPPPSIATATARPCATCARASRPAGESLPDGYIRCAWLDPWRYRASIASCIYLPSRHEPVSAGGGRA